VAQGDGDLMTALHLACDKGFEELARLLVEHKADVSAVRLIAFSSSFFSLFSFFCLPVRLTFAVVFVVRTENGGRRT
jgi:ankyrin repeat protein